MGLILSFVALILCGALSLASAVPYIPPRTAQPRRGETAGNLSPVAGLVLVLNLMDSGLPWRHPWVFAGRVLPALSIVLLLYAQYSTVARRWRDRTE